MSDVSVHDANSAIRIGAPSVPAPPLTTELRQDAEMLVLARRQIDDCQALLDLLGVPRRSQEGLTFSLQHRLGVLNDEYQQEIGHLTLALAAAQVRADNETMRANQAERRLRAQSIGL